MHACMHETNATTGTLEDEVEHKFLEWCEGKLKMTVKNLLRYAQTLGPHVASGPKRRMQVLERIAQALQSTKEELKTGEAWTSDDSVDGPGCGDEISSDEGSDGNE